MWMGEACVIGIRGEGRWEAQSATFRYAPLAMITVDAQAAWLFRRAPP